MVDGDAVGVCTGSVVAAVGVLVFDGDAAGVESSGADTVGVAAAGAGVGMSGEGSASPHDAAAIKANTTIPATRDRLLPVI